MAKLNVEEKFEEFKAAFKKKWKELGSDELDSMLEIRENEEEMIEKMAVRYNKTKEEMKKDFEEWLEKVEEEKEDDVEEILEDIDDINQFKK